jgi:YtkA-like
MQLQRSTRTYRLVLIGFLGCAAMVLAARQHAGEAHDDEGGKGGHQHAARGCRGFVILPNGFAVLSGLSATPVHSSAGAPPGAARAGVTMADKGHTSGAAPHLMGYTHGQEIVPQEDMLCVPIVGAGTLRWSAMGHKAAPTVTVEAPKGALTHGHRTNTALILAVRQGDTPVEQAQVRLLARMPHHDRRMPGGHGSTNDPDVQGIVVQPVGQGRYTIPAIDFTMAGPWLLEVQVQQESEMHTVYLAASIGEE